MEIKETDNVIGTSWFQGTINTTANKLTKLFGEPYRYVDDKTQYEWNLECNGISFSIYDYKEDEEINPNEKIDWHIGTKNKKESNYITKILKEKLNGA